MKACSTYFLAFAMVFVASMAVAQDLPDYDKVILAEAGDYMAADPTALTAAQHVLSVPLTDANRIKSLQFIIKWMSGTPDYTFNIDAVVEKLTKGNEDMLGVYLAAMTKFALEHTDQAKDAKAVKLNAVGLVLDYVENPAYNIKMTKSLKKLCDARSKGELEKEISN